MLTCSKCGTENEFGRVFCNDCGAKLDMSNVTRDTVVKQNKKIRFLRHWPKVVIGLVVLLVLLVVLAFWPDSRRIGEAGTRIGGRRVEEALSAIRDLEDGQSVEVTLSEKDINGYLEFFTVKKLGIKAVACDVSPGYFKVRMIRTAGPFNLGFFTFEPHTSFDYVCMPYGGRVAVRKVRMGHLKLSGGMKRNSIRKFYGLMSADDCWDVMTHLTEVRAEQDAFTLVLEK